MGSQSSGEGGILGQASSQSALLLDVATQAIARVELHLTSLLCIICGYLWSVGVAVSTVSAQALACGGGSPEAATARNPVQSTWPSEPDERQPSRGTHRFGAASYSRYSSDHQNESSIDDQQRECRQGAEAISTPTLADCEFFDMAVSGTKRNRAGLNALIAAAEERRFSVLFFHSLSRLGRESVITMPLLKLLVYVHGIRVISISDGVDSDKTGWEMMATICCLQNEQYLRELRANVRRGQEGTIFANLCVGDYRFGYGSIPSPNGEMVGRGRNVRPRKIYVVDEEAARWVKQVFHWFVKERRAIQWIVRELNLAKVPTDHRSTSKEWSHDTVVSLLRSKKYIGLWRWGVLQNERNPLTGVISQKMRKPTDVARWDRDFPHLQIVENEVFREAQMILDENSEAFRAYRKEKGKLTGSPKGRYVGHLLSGLIQCPCGHKFHVRGSKGLYLSCPKYSRGLCSCRTQLPRSVAAEKILNAIGERVLANPTWITAIFDSVLKAWQAATTTRPREIEKLQSQISTLNSKIERLVDKVENSTAPNAALDARLLQRQEEKTQLQDMLRSLQSQAIEPKVAPTRTWVEEQLGELGKVLQGATPAAGVALRRLLMGPVFVTEIAVPGKKRRYLIGEFQIRVGKLAMATLPMIQCSDLDSADDLVETIKVEFRRPQKWDDRLDEAWALLEGNVPILEIAKTLKIPKSKIGKVLDAAAEARGVTRVDGRKRRHMPECQTAERKAREQFIDTVKRLWDDDLENQQIAERLGTCRDTVTKAVADWHMIRGLSVPDGRSRRWKLPKTSIVDNQAPGAEDGTSASPPQPEAEF